MGFFSWHTLDTDRSIANWWVLEKRNEARLLSFEKPMAVFPVFMICPKTRNVWVEKRYDGYGVFGKKDFYDLVAELNGVKTREKAVGLYFAEDQKCGVLWPILVERLENAKNFDGTLKPKTCNKQGFFYASEQV